MGEDDKKPDRRSRSMLGTAFKTGAKAISTASSALKSEPVKKLRGGIRSVAGGLAGVGRFVRSNSLRGLLGGEIVLSEGELNRWFARVDRPEGVSHMELRCRPSRLVLVMHFERKLFGLPLGKSTVDLPFEIETVEIDAEGGIIELRLDKVDVPEARGLVRPIIKRLLSRAAADLLEEKSPLERLDLASDAIERHGNRLVIDVGAYPPFVELMNRELRLIGGTSLFPFRAIVVTGARVEEGRLLVSTRFELEEIAVRRVTETLEELDAGDADALPVQIVQYDDDEYDDDDDDLEDDVDDVDDDPDDDEEEAPAR